MEKSREEWRRVEKSRIEKSREKYRSIKLVTYSLFNKE